jgi:hypothetical protein
MQTVMLKNSNSETATAYDLDNPLTQYLYHGMNAAAEIVFEGTILLWLEYRQRWYRDTA